MKNYRIEEYVQQLESNELLISQKYTGEIGRKVVKRVAYHCDKVIMGTLFVCKGIGFEEKYLDTAIEKGAIAYISEKDYNKDIPCIIVNNIQQALSIIANMYYNYPWQKLKLIGITGTKGKSTTSYYVKYILDEYLKSREKLQSGIVSSINTFDGKTEFESHLTTPESLDLQMHFNNAVDSNLQYMVTEVSSQAFKYGRLFGVDFDIGVFLNISEDHISPIEHKDLEDYFTSKLRLFNQCKVACVNLETDFVDRVLEAAKNTERVITFGTRPEADIYGYNILKDGFDTVFSVRSDKFDKEFRLTMPGLFNVENALAAIAVAYILNIPEEYIYSGLEKAKSSGRMEIYTSKNKEKIVIVDYAHNKLSFESLYSSVEAEYPDKKIITIFGCPGGKAYLRRRDLGLLSGIHSEKVVLTAEDPGNESVQDICGDIAQYVKENNNNFEIIEDREEAIRETILHSDVNSVILITGKGNEKRQKIGKKYVKCRSDVECTIKYLKEYDRAVLKTSGRLKGDDGYIKSNNAV